MIRGLAAIAALILFVVGGVLGYIAVVALRRSEGVFLPAGYVAIICLVAGGFMCRVAIRG